MVSPSIVRVATEADRIEVWRLLLQSHNENGMFPLSPEKVDWWLGRMLNPESIPEWDTGPRGTIGVIGPVGHLEGLVFVIIGGFWYTDSRHLEELVVYVDPEFRQSSHSKTLIDWMKKQSLHADVPLLTGVISNHRTEAKVKLYERMQLPKVGAFFLFNGKGSVIGSSAVAMA